MAYNRTATLESNIRAHDRVAKKYEKIHGEIYNEFEQNRLREDLATAIKNIQTDSHIKKAIDFGCGAGNLTTHMASLGVEVIASDISQGFLDLVSSRTYHSKVETLKLNGKDISNVADASIDMIATYSVLHHVPDYLGILKEFMRVLKKGGIVYIDHETSPNYWLKDPNLVSFESEISKSSKTEIGKYLLLTNYIDWVIRKFVNSRFRREGDIHVFDDDHIEWTKVVDVLLTEGGEVVIEKDYLLFKRNYDTAIYNKYKSITSDMHLLVMRKR